MQRYIVLVADSDEIILRMLDCHCRWCSQTKMGVNIIKQTQVVHFRKNNKPQTDFEFKEDSDLELCHKVHSKIFVKFYRNSRYIE